MRQSPLDGKEKIIKVRSSRSANLNSFLFNHLCNIDSQLTKVKLNTEAFAKGLLANNVLMTGSRGTGKSSIVKACLNEYHHLGLRVIELEKSI